MFIQNLLSKAKRRVKGGRRNSLSPEAELILAEELAEMQLTLLGEGLVCKEVLHNSLNDWELRLRGKVTA